MAYTKKSQDRPESFLGVRFEWVVKRGELKVRSEVMRRLNADSPGCYRSRMLMPTVTTMAFLRRVSSRNSKRSRISSLI